MLCSVEWVYANIGQFGGDASRITLWGQSAGSQSVDYFNFAYYDDPIVAGLIMDSGSASSGSPFDTQHTNFSFVASQVGCEGYSEQPAEQLSCMRSIDVKTLENFLYGYTVNGSTPSLTFRPVIDEKLVFSNYTARALDGYVANIVSPFHRFSPWIFLMTDPVLAGYHGHECSRWNSFCTL